MSAQSVNFWRLFILPSAVLDLRCTREFSPPVQFNKVVVLLGISHKWTRWLNGWRVVLWIKRFRPRGGGGGRGGWGLPYKNGTPKRYQDPILRAWLSPLRGTNSYITHYLLSYFFRLNSLKGIAKAPAVDLLRPNTLRGTKTTYRYDEHPRPFYMGVPPPGPDTTAHRHS